MRLALTALCLVCLLAPTLPAWAADAAAAVELYRAGKYREAIAEWQAAHAEEPRQANLCNLGRAYKRLKEWPEAHSYLTRCVVGESKLLARRAEADLERVLKQLQRGPYAEVRVSATPAEATASFPGLLDGRALALPSVVWLSRGPGEVRVGADGYVSQTVTFQLGGPGVTVAVVLEEGSGEAPPVALGGHAAPLVETGMPGSIMTSRSPTGAYVAIGAGAALIVGGVISHIAATGTRSDAEGLGPGTAFDDKESQFQLERGLALGFYGVGAVVLGVGIYLLVDHDGGPVVAPGPGGGSVTWRF